MNSDLMNRVVEEIVGTGATQRGAEHAARAIIPLVLEDAAKVVRDCNLYDDKMRLLNSDPRETCAAAIRAEVQHDAG